MAEMEGGKGEKREWEKKRDDAALFQHAAGFQVTPLFSVWVDP